MSHIELIGISGESLGTDQRALIAGCVLVAHSRRQEPLLQGIAVERVAITPLAGLYTAIASALAAASKYPGTISPSSVCMAARSKIRQPGFCITKGHFASLISTTAQTALRAI